MSASPAQQSGPNSVTPTTGGPANVVRRKPPVNIFNNKKKPVKKVPAPASAQRGAAPPPKAANGVQNGASILTPLQQAQGLTPDPSTYVEYPIFISRRAFEAGQRFHAMKLHTKLDNSGKPTIVNPYEQFTRPLRLHRRFARDKMETAGQSDGASGIDDKEREQMNARRLERQAEREENQKLIAPTGGDTGKPIKKKPQKKVEEGRDESDPVKLKRRQLRYEEARSWHLEDFEGKNIWVGTYEEALSERSIMFEVGTRGFKTVPIEKWYKFTQVRELNDNALSGDEVDKYMAKKAMPGRWAMGTQKSRPAVDEETKKEIEFDEQERIEKENKTRARQQRFVNKSEFHADKDLLDVEYGDEFQDDDEGMLFQAEEGEDAKDIEKRLWLEMRDAGLSGTGVKNDDIDPEEQERKRQMAEQQQKDLEKKLKKQLMRRENKGEYLSDDDSDPFEDSSEDEEEQKTEEQKAEEGKKVANDDKSGASSRGTNTPSGRPEKRPNPDMSDLSGNESSRKRVKGANGAAIAAGRSLSPDATKIKSKLARSNVGSGSGSDTDTSRASRPRKTKVMNGFPGSQSASRAVSPSASASRAQSPKPNGVGNDASFPTLEEVQAAIPVAGIEIKALVALFKARLGKRGQEFIILVKKAGTQDKASGKIMPKPA